MNYMQHSMIGLGTAGLGLWLGRAAGLWELPGATALLVAGTAVVAGSVSVDVDHPQAWISRQLPLYMLGRTLPVLLLLGGLVAGLSLALGCDVVVGLGRLLGVSLVRWLLAVAGLAVGLMITAQLVSKTVKHRGALHSLTFSTGITLLAVSIAIWAGQAWEAWRFGLAFGWGWIFHCLADFLTPFGVPLWWPFSNKRVGLFMIHRSG